MTIQFVKNDGTVMTSISVIETPRPDIEDIYDDNNYIEDIESFIDEIKSELAYCQRQLKNP